MTNYENDIQVITKNGAEGELTQVSINNGEIENVNTTTLPSEANELNPLAEPAATGQKNIISVDEASSVSSGNNIYINQDNKLMQIDYDTLATAILNKLSTQSFDSLNTSSKLVLDAINELNGKSGAVTDENTLNAVEKLKSEVWSSYDTGTILETFLAGGPLFCVIGYKSTDDYGAVILFSYFSNRASFVRVASGSWSTPVYV